MSISAGSPLTAEQAAEANAIDAPRTQAMLTVERQYCKLRMGRVSFSPMTELPKRRIVFWTLTIKRRKGGRVSSNLWRRKKSQAGITEPIGCLSLHELSTWLHQARQEYRGAKQSHVTSRENFLQSLGTKDSQRLLRVEKQ